MKRLFKLKRGLKARLKAIILMAAMSTGLLTFTGCSQENANNGKINIVCTTYPQYNWIENILGEEADRFNLVLLVDGGADLHSYQPSAKDMAKISSADMFVYVGGSSDAWVSDAVRETANSNIKKVNMMELIGDRAKEEELVEGMQSDEHGHGHTAGEDSHQDNSSQEDIEYDEHIWLSVRNAQVLTQKLADVIKELDTENAEEATRSDKDGQEVISLTKPSTKAEGIKNGTLQSAGSVISLDDLDISEEDFKIILEMTKNNPPRTKEEFKRYEKALKDMRENGERLKNVGTATKTGSGISILGSGNDTKESNVGTAGTETSTTIVSQEVTDFQTKHMRKFNFNNRAFSR